MLLPPFLPLSSLRELLFDSAGLGDFDLLELDCPRWSIDEG